MQTWLHLPPICCKATEPTPTHHGHTACFYPIYSAHAVDGADRDPVGHGGHYFVYFCQPHAHVLDVRGLA